MTRVEKSHYLKIDFKSSNMLSDDFDPQEVIHVMKWWLSSNLQRKRLAMAVGGFSEVIQEAYLSMLKNPSQSDYKLTTIVVNHTDWTLKKMYKRTCNEMQNKIRDINAIKPTTMDSDIVQKCIDKDVSAECWAIVEDKLDKRISGIVRRSMNGYTFVEIGKTYSLSKERIRQLQSRGIRILQQRDITVLFDKFL